MNLTAKWESRIHPKCSSVVQAGLFAEPEDEQQSFYDNTTLLKHRINTAFKNHNNSIFRHFLIKIANFPVTPEST
jgi:hypothetical protein